MLAVFALYGVYTPGQVVESGRVFFGQVRIGNLNNIKCHKYQVNLEGKNMQDPSPTLETLTQRLIEFRDARDWRQFHSLKDLILSLSLEASELVELTQWKPEQQFEEEANTEEMQQRLREECADVLLYLLLVAERSGMDLCQAADEKLNANELKYPVEKSRGTSAKYTKLR